MVPFSKKDLLGLSPQVTDRVADLVRRDFFHFNDTIVIEKTALKVIFALELVNVKEFGSKKLDIDVKNVNTDAVIGSLKTWVTPFHYVHFKALAGLGEIICNPQNNKSRIKEMKSCIRANWSAENREEIFSMFYKIIEFEANTKTGKHSFKKEKLLVSSFKTHAPA